MSIREWFETQPPMSRVAQAILEAIWVPIAERHDLDVEGMTSDEVDAAVDALRVKEFEALVHGRLA